MNRPLVRSLAVCLALSLPMHLEAASLQAFSPEPQEPVLNLSFGPTEGRIGEEVSLPINISSDSNFREPFTVVLRFPPSKFRYVKLGRGSLPNKYDWEIQPHLRTAPPAFDMHFLEIEVTPGPEDFFPEGGLLALAYFQVREASEDHAIELKPSLKVETGNPVEVVTAPAEIVGRPEALLACFFYMH